MVRRGGRFALVAGDKLVIYLPCLPSRGYRYGELLALIARPTKFAQKERVVI